MRRTKQNERGASAVEFALTLPFLLAILLGIMEFGWMFFTDIQVTNAARDGARRGAVAPKELVCQAARERAQAVLQNAGLNGSVEIATECQPGSEPGPEDESLRVQIIYTYEPLTPLASLPFIPQVLLPASVQGTAIMHVDTGEGCGEGC